MWPEISIHRAEGYSSPVSVSVEELGPMQLPFKAAANGKPIAAHAAGVHGGNAGDKGPPTQGGMQGT